jgi:methionyl-tRNA synthetase
MTLWNRTLVTAALPYANGAVHLGHLAGAYLPADIYVRYLRLRGRDVVFISGSDEHGVSILISASKENVPPQTIIDRYHEANKQAFARVGISFDNYSRTSLPLHHRTAQEWFLDFHEKGVLRRYGEQQLFDEKAAMFLPDRFVTGTCPHCGFDRAYGDQCENCSKYYKQTELLQPKSLLTGETPVVRDAVHWYFPLGDFQQRLEEYVESHAGDWKDNVLQQVRSWLKAGLSDRPISRDLAWGVPVPLEGEAGKVLYVWFEAVLGYISSTREWAEAQGAPERWKDYWCEPDTRYIAFIGKDNIVFHCLMFPAMLMAKGGYVLPDNVPANEFLNLQGQKFSKSRNWSIELHEFLDRFPADPLRYTLTLNMPETRDSDFYWKDFQARTNNELADILGNFVNRSLHFAHKNFGGLVPAPGIETDEDRAFLAEFGRAADAVAGAFERFRFRDGLQAAMTFARTCNKYFNDAEPWKTLKSDPGRAATAIHHCAQAVRALGILLAPVLPDTAVKIRGVLGLPDDALWTWDSIATERLPAGHALGTLALLFQKIEDDVIDSIITGMEAASAEADANAPVAAPSYPPIKDQIVYETFSSLDLRVGVVLSAERVPKSDKLLKLVIDIGIEQRQVVAGIGNAYDPAELIGTQVVFVANLKPAKLFGIESQGMVLAASEADGRPVLLAPAGATGTGSIVK